MCPLFGGAEPTRVVSGAAAITKEHAITGLVHVLDDLENVQSPAVLLEDLAPGVANAWIFHGPHQEKVSKSFKTLIGERATLVPIMRTGNNALDFHLSFYLGYVAAKHPDARLVVVANDKATSPAASPVWRKDAVAVPNTSIWPSTPAVRSGSKVRMKSPYFPCAEVARPGIACFLWRR